MDLKNSHNKSKINSLNEEDENQARDAFLICGNINNIHENVDYFFYYNSNIADNLVWNPYPQNVQECLNHEYVQFLKGGTSKVILGPPSEEFIVDFNDLIQKKINDEFYFSHIRIEQKSKFLEKKNIDNKKNRISKNPVNIIFFFEDMNIINSKFEETQIKFPNEKVYITFSKEFLLEKLNELSNKTIIITSSSECLIFKEEGLLDKTQLEAVFLLRSFEEDDSQWTKSFPKIKEISNDNSIIIFYLNTELDKTYFKNFENVKFKAGFHFNTKEACIYYMYNQIIFDLFKGNLLSIEQSKEDFIDLCNENKNEFEEDDLIDIIKNIKEDQFHKKIAVNWYTRESYFYRLLNGILRDDDILKLFRVRYVIYKLMHALNDYKLNGNIPEYLYRGSRINENELRLFNEANNGKMKIIQLRGFTSTSKNISIPLLFAKNSHLFKKEGEKCVMYMIKTDNDLGQLFDIKDASDIPNEDEILLSFDTILKIESIKNSNEKYIDYFINCKITNFLEIDIDDGTKEIKEIFKINKKSNNDNFYLADLLMKLRKDDELIELMHRTRCIDDLNLSHKYNLMASVYRNQGKYEDALNYYFKSLEIKDKILGISHIETASSYNNLAIVYREQGKYEQALNYYFKSLKILEENLGISHPDTALSYNNIGLVYDSQGKYEHALNYYFKSLKIREQIFGMLHPDTATSYNNIATLYDDLGNYETALNYYFKSLKIREQIFGISHPDTATCYNNIASVYKNQGKYEEALSYFFKSLKIIEHKLGTSHPDTALSYNNIASIYKNQAKYEDAFTYYFKSLKIREDKLGISHPLTATSYNNIATVYDDLTKYEDALIYYFKSLKIREEKLGISHPNTATSYNNIASVYRNQGKYQDALIYFFKSLKIREENLGISHPETASSYNNIAIVYNELEKHQDALNYYLISLKIREEKLGISHPDTATSYNNIATLYDDLGNYESALNYYFKSLKIREKIFGISHPDTITCYNNIASVYRNQGKYEESLSYFFKSLKIREENLGMSKENSKTNK